jgi:protein-tyrosine phosphatase
VVEVGSAGTLALYGQPAARGSCEVGARWGLSLEDHRAMPVSYHDLATLALVLTMEGAHRRELTSRAPALGDRCFTVLELVAIVTGHVDAGDLDALPDPAADPRARLEAVAALAHAHRPRWRRRRRMDIPDPIGGDTQVFDRLADELEEVTSVLAPALFGPVNER